jgi:hypothetical protein
LEEKVKSVIPGLVSEPPGLAFGKPEDRLREAESVGNPAST